MPTAAPARRPTSRARPPRRAPARSTPRRPAPAPLPADGYLRYSKSPWASFLFVLPLLALHEVGLALYAPAGGAEPRVTAYVPMARFFDAIGSSGWHLPAVAVVTVLLAWQVWTDDSFAVRPGAVLCMAGEAFAWAVPLVGVYVLVGRGVVTALPPAAGDARLAAAMYLGAGVYEEAVFRLAGFALLSLLLVDLGKMQGWPGRAAVVATAAAAFSAYHLLGTQGWPWQAFVFTGLRGVYYGIIFHERGFGLSVGVHTAYDLLVLAAAGAAMK